LHFVSAPQYRERVIQLGENPENVFLVGGLGVDAIKRTEMLSKKDLEIAIDFTFGEKNILIAFHPVTLESQSSANQMRELLAALADLHNTNLIFTMPNADNGSRELTELLMNFVSKNPRARIYKSLGQLHFLSCLQYVDGIVGNSSSGILEAPSLGIGTVNIGDRQKGRIAANTVIDCLPIREAIFDSIQKLYDPSFLSLMPVANP
jgi:GDP/UDP-N,N'-diacetylbacillosamine 2-epimerase (hydrolysing)